ncbi:MAG: FeoA family protein [Planctomycetota bacterium]|nr:FeoA family protein [Planctomycetota bacterium]
MSVKDKGEATAMPLAMASVGQEVTFHSAHGGRGFQHRLAEMGLTPGISFRVLAKGSPGPFIITVKNTRLLLGHGMVHRIRVSLI